MILALDISTRCTGFCVIDPKTRKVQKYGTFDFSDKEVFTSLYVSCKYAESALKLIQKEFPINRVVIEEPLLSFKGGQSSAGVIALLQRFNGMLSLICQQIFGREPELINAAHYRSQLGLKVPRELKKAKAKQFIAEWAQVRVPEFIIEKTKKGNPKPEVYDQADAIVLALWSLDNS